MKSNSTETVFILDRSACMNGLEGDTIGGYNSFLEKQREVKGEVKELIKARLYNSINNFNAKKHLA